MTFEQFELEIGYSFKNKELLRHALTHSSYANEHKLPYSNERPEFLGDSVLGFITAEYLYNTMQGHPEGELTVMRAKLVCEQSLYTFACSIGIGQALLLGKGEQATGGRERPSLLADAFEAVVAALYLDGGMNAAKPFVMRFIAGATAPEQTQDYKSRLQEEVQSVKGNVIQYKELGESGPDHHKTFTFGVLLNGECIGTGSGNTKKDAQQQAARDALSNRGKS